MAVPDLAVESDSASVLGVEVPTQDQDLWCWCAITVGVSRFFDASFSLSQCETAANVLGLADACSRPGDDDVNKMFALDAALASFDRLLRRVDGRLSFEQLKREIDAGRPVGVRIRFQDSGQAHFTLIRGYRTEPAPMLAIDDPLYGESTWSFAEFVDNYRGAGVWRQSYLTR